MISDPIIQSDIAAELQPGETILWLGKPMALRIALQDRDAVVTSLLALAALVVVLVGLPVLVFFNLLFFGVGFPLLSLLFAAILLYYFARPFSAYLRAARTTYAITDRRVLIITSGLHGRVVQSFNHIERVERHDLADGKGDLIFGSETQATRGGAGYRLRTRKVGFFGIANPRQVEQTLLTALSGAPGGQWV